MSTILITGGAGFIGSHLTLSFVRDGHKIVVLDNFSSRSRSEFEDLTNVYSGSIQIIDGDIRDKKACRAAALQADYVLHHAALASVPGSIERPDETVEVNILGTTNVLAAAAATGLCRRFVFASSSAVYGDLLPEVKTETQLLDPLSPYATSKLTGEMLCKNFAGTHGLPTVALRYFNVFGVRQDPNGPYAAVIPKFVDSIRIGECPTIFGDGKQSRDFVSVRDVVLANRLATQAPQDLVAAKVFNIGSGQRTTLNGLLKVFEHLLGRPVSAMYLPERPGDILHSLADISRAREELGFCPSVVLQDGLRELLL